MKIIAVTQARTGSSRLPNKVLKEIGGESLLSIHLKRVLKSKKIDKLIVATTTEDNDIKIVEEADKLGLNSYRGSVSDVLDRFYRAVKNEKPDWVVRLTSDCPLIDAELIDKTIQYAIENDFEYCSNTLNPVYPDGQDVEIFTFSALEKAHKEAKLSSEREHVSPYIWKNSTYKGGNIFKSGTFSDTEESYGHIRMTVDEDVDFELIKRIVNNLGVDKTWWEYTKAIIENKEEYSVNQSIKRNEGYDKSLKEDKEII